MIVKCSSCNAQFNAPDDTQGQYADCPSCNSLIELTPMSQASAPASRLPLSSQQTQQQKASPQHKVAASGATRSTAPGNKDYSSVGIRLILVFISILTGIGIAIALFAAFSEDKSPGESFTFVMIAISGIVTVIGYCVIIAILSHLQAIQDILRDK